MLHARLHGLIAATHTPFHADGSLNLAAVELQLAHLWKWNVTAVFISGTTGESQSLNVEERRALAERWCAAVRGTAMRVIVHVGSNCLVDSAALARHAQQHGAAAVSAIAPSYFKPRSLDALIACSAEIAAAAPEIPFYYYDIPPLTGLAFSMPEFLEKAQARIPNLAGIKFSNTDIAAYLQCLCAAEGRWDMPWGVDEAMLGALATGARGFVGSSYNFAAPLYHRLMEAFAHCDLDAAREEQLRSARLLGLVARHGYIGAAKAVMEMLGVPVGPARLPVDSLSPPQARELRGELDSLGFFEWLSPQAAS